MPHDITIPCILPRLGNLVEGWTGPVVDEDGPCILLGVDPWERLMVVRPATDGHLHYDGEKKYAEGYWTTAGLGLALDCTRPEVQALLLAIHRREGQPIDSWFWGVPEEHRAALIRWSTLRLAAGMKAALGWWGGCCFAPDSYGWTVQIMNHGPICGPETGPEGLACARAVAHRLGIWVPGYSEDQPDPEVK